MGGLSVTIERHENFGVTDVSGNLKKKKKKKKKL